MHRNNYYAKYLQYIEIPFVKTLLDALEEYKFCTVEELAFILAASYVHTLGTGQPFEEPEGTYYDVLPARSDCTYNCAPCKADEFDKYSVYDFYTNKNIFNARGFVPVRWYNNYKTLSEYLYSKHVLMTPSELLQSPNLLNNHIIEVALAIVVDKIFLTPKQRLLNDFNTFDALYLTLNNTYCDQNKCRLAYNAFLVILLKRLTKTQKTATNIKLEDTTMFKKILNLFVKFVNVVKRKSSVASVTPVDDTVIEYTEKQKQQDSEAFIADAVQSAVDIVVKRLSSKTAFKQLRAAQNAEDLQVLIQRIVANKVEHAVKQKTAKAAANITKLFK